jgi:hypothetical protein
VASVAVSDDSEEGPTGTPLILRPLMDTCSMGAPPLALSAPAATTCARSKPQYYPLGEVRREGKEASHCSISMMREEKL